MGLQSASRLEMLLHLEIVVDAHRTKLNDLVEVATEAGRLDVKENERHARIT